MKTVVAVLRELWGLFVEDLSFTLALLACLALALVVGARVVPDPWRGVAFFALLALVLLENVRRSARPP